MVMEIVCIVASLLIFSLSSQGHSGLAMVIDPPTMLCMLVLCAPVLFRRGIMRDFMRGFKLLRKGYTCKFSELRNTLDVVEMMQRQVLYAASITMVQGIFQALSIADDWTMLPYHIGIALIAVFYAAILEMLLLPLQIEAKRRIVDFMEREEDVV